MGMDGLARDGDAAIRKMNPDAHDFALMLKWMTDPETMRWWDGMTQQYTMERVVAAYRRHVQEQVQPCMLEWRGVAVGYCQFCRVDAESYEVPREEYERFASPGEIVYGIDLFIGEIAVRNRGVGTQLLRTLMRALFIEYGADALLVDPKVHNARAIRCYEKCGFQRLFVAPQREEQDGSRYDSLIMGARHPEH